MELVILSDMIRFLIPFACAIDAISTVCVCQYNIVCTSVNIMPKTSLLNY